MHEIKDKEIDITSSDEMPALGTQESSLDEEIVVKNVKGKKKKTKRQVNL